jgi:hypothetical protein
MDSAMDVQRKLEIPADAAKYDACCSMAPDWRSGSSRRRRNRDLGFDSQRHREEKRQRIIILDSETSFDARRNSCEI